MSALTLSVEAFLAQERDKLSKERKALQDILNDLEDEQEVLCKSDHHLYDKSTNTENVRNEDCLLQNGTIKIQAADHNFNSSYETSNFDCKDTLSNVITDSGLENTSKPLTLSKCDYQIEKQRLANIFANAPFVLQSSSRTYHQCKSSRSNRKTRIIPSKFEDDKENVPPENVQLNDKPKSMVRYGEFSPLNPDFQSTGRPFVGLGEYEERRRILLEKKKREYQDYLKIARMKQELRSSQRTNRNCQIICENENQSHLPPCSTKATEIFVPKQDDRRRLLQFQQELYRKELDRQVEEKRKLKEIQEYKEQQECRMVEQRETACRKNLSNCIEAEFSKRMDNVNEPAHSSDEKPKDGDRDGFAVSPEQVDVEVSLGKDLRVVSDPKSTILKQSTETCQVNDMEGYRKMQRELYNEELKKQIKEKRKFDEEQKRREEEIDRKIEEERLRREYEQEQAEKAFEIRQKHEHEKRILENLNQMKKQNQIRTYPKSTDIWRTNLRFDDMAPVKNVTFLPHTYVHDYHTDDYREADFRVKQCDKINDCPSASIIVNAPYELAVKDVSITDDSKTESKRSMSPVIPALRTRNLLKAAPKCKQLDIPSSVSMSEKAKACYIRDEKILSRMTEIRRTLRENLPKTTLD